MRRLTEAEFDALRCKRCGQRSDWHSYDDGACSDDDGPHPYSLAADSDPDACAACDAADQTMKFGGCLVPCPDHS